MLPENQYDRDTRIRNMTATGWLPDMAPLLHNTAILTTNFPSHDTLYDTLNIKVLELVDT